MPNQAHKLICPQCRKRFIPVDNSTWHPFCSERCRLIDLGDWLEEKHRIPDDSESNPFRSSDEN